MGTFKLNSWLKYSYSVTRCLFTDLKWYELFCEEILWTPISTDSHIYIAPFYVPYQLKITAKHQSVCGPYVICTSTANRLGLYLAYVISAHESLSVLSDMIISIKDFILNEKNPPDAWIWTQVGVRHQFLNTNTRPTLAGWVHWALPRSCRPSLWETKHRAEEMFTASSLKSASPSWLGARSV